MPSPPARVRVVPGSGDGDGGGRDGDHSRPGRGDLSFGAGEDPSDPGTWTIREASLPFAPAALFARACLLGFPPAHRKAAAIQHACAFLAWLDAAGQPWRQHFFTAWMAASGYAGDDVRYHLAVPVQLREMARGIDLAPGDLRATLVAAIEAGVPVDVPYLTWWLRFVATGARPVPGAGAACIHFSSCRLFVASGTIPRVTGIKAACSSWHPFAPRNVLRQPKAFTAAAKEASPHRATCYQVNYGLLGKAVVLVACTPGPRLAAPGDLPAVLDIPGMLVRANPVQGDFGSVPAGGCYLAVYNIPRRALDAVRDHVKALATHGILGAWTVLVARSCTIGVNWNAYVPGPSPKLAIAPRRHDPRLVQQVAVDYGVPRARAAACTASVLSRPRAGMVRFLDCLNSPFSHGEGLEGEGTTARVAAFCGVRRETASAWLEEFAGRQRLLVPDPRVAMYLQPNAGFLAKVLFTGRDGGKARARLPWDEVMAAVPVATLLDCTDERGRGVPVVAAGVPGKDIHRAITRVHGAWHGAAHAIEFTSSIFETRYANASFVSLDGRPDPGPAIAAARDAIEGYAAGRSGAGSIARALAPVAAMAGVEGW